jgi:hypothetical protein
VRSRDCFYQEYINLVKNLTIENKNILLTIYKILPEIVPANNSLEFGNKAVKVKASLLQQFDQDQNNLQNIWKKVIEKVHRKLHDAHHDNGYHSDSTNANINIDNTLEIIGNDALDTLVQIDTLI